MKTRERIFTALAVSLLIAGAPALAQETPASTTQNTAQEDVIGPPQLSGFSLNGTVTRSAPAPVEVQPATGQTSNRPAAGQASPSTQSASPSRSERPTGSATSAPPPRTEVARTVERPPSQDRVSANLSPPPAAPSVDQSDSSSSLGLQPDFTAPASTPALDSSHKMPILPWLIAALTLAAAAGWYFFRQRPRESYAGAHAHLFEAPAPQARVPAAAPPARPKPRQAPQPASSGIVSTRLRPWLEIEFTPTRAVVDREKAAVEFELSLFNSGSADARNVLIEGWLTNASAHQDQQIRTFFDNPTAKGDRIPVIAPLQRIALKNAVFLPLTELRPLEIEGRQLFVPMVAFNALYGWSRGEGQTSTSYLVGKVGKSDKLGAFRMDQGPRLFRGLAAREHEIRVRN